MVRDDIIEYSLHEHHSEEEGKKIRKKIWKVTIILSVITILEVLVGAFFPKDSFAEGSIAWELIKYGYIVLTVIKAGYIVLVFMHLGDEAKSLKYMILVPYTIFILYLLFIVFTEAAYIGDGWMNMH
ncbi:MAG: cytochrome C oxidase subunit IV family protein [Crocinitomix sp.]|nr:cytochrome C oxidase subunit IV family protein [Crocinitomix sp.]|tara:strand:+ start:2252 stop:2632 length:381 start_codon:yes stop_codon:yes gene_type:complete